MSKKIITAPATAQGIAGVSMIRLSGENCITLCDTIFEGTKSLSSYKGNSIAYGRIFDPVNQKLIDEVLIGVFRAPMSFTGEESLEIWTHGSPFIVKEVIRLLLSLGACMADPGEFSMRAFLNGKIDLTQAEAIRDLTHAQTKFAHAQALGRLEGGLSAQISSIHKKVLDLLAMLEVSIDHSDEELDLETTSHFSERIDRIIYSIDSLLSGANIGRMSVEGIKVALIGRPNAGKSSLLNALVKEDRVIVSDIAGTTRDVIEHTISTRGLMLRFFDTAGLRETDDILEKEGTKRSLQAVEKADYILFLIDSVCGMTPDDQEIWNNLPNKPKTVILSKSDLNPNCSEEGIKVSSFTGEGVDSILDLLEAFYHSGGIDPENDILIANLRQQGLLDKAKNELSVSLSCIQNKDSEEFVAVHVRKARIFLEEIVGKTTDDAVLDRIFSQFCIGK